tara:strand:+ start:55 stop:294 length:240 start_codon:yes stop_codon:yes gene_type:complete
MKDVKYYKGNCQEDYLHTPISVLRYIGELEKEIETKPLNIASVSNLLIDFWRALPNLKKKYLLPEEQSNMVRDFLKNNL